MSRLSRGTTTSTTSPRAPRRPRLPRRPFENQAPHHQQHRRAHGRDSYRAEVQRALGDAAPSEEGAEPSTNERAGDAEGDRDEAAGGVASRNEELREPSSEETEQDPVEPERHCA